MRTNRVAQSRAELLDELGLLVLAFRYRRRASEPLEPHAAVLPNEQVTCGQLAHVAEDRQRRRDRVERKERLDRVEVDLAAWQPPQLGREGQLAVDVPVVERLDPEAVAHEHEPAA